MKKNLIITIVTFVVCISSCKKENTTTNTTQNCKLIEYVTEDADKYEITLNGNLITKIKGISSSVLGEYNNYYYNTDSILTHIYYFDNQDKLTDVDTFIYSIDKKLLTRTHYDIVTNSRVFYEKETFSYNSINQIVNVRDSFYYYSASTNKRDVFVSVFTYQNGKIYTNIETEYVENTFAGVEKDTFIYTTDINNLIYNIKVPAFVFSVTNNSSYVDYIELNTNNFISQKKVTLFDENNNFDDSYIDNFTYTFEDGKVKSIKLDSELLHTFNYKCE